MVAGLEARDVVVRYKDVTAVDGVSLHLQPGHVLALLGPSGSGKSTLLRAIAGLAKLDAGSIHWNGEDLSAVKVHKRNFGFVFQDGQLFPNLNVGRNVAYGLGKWQGSRQDRVAEMLELVGLAGYEKRKTTELSGGEAQRIALARSLAPSPRALLLDEPLSALDTGLRRHLAGEVSRILREVGTTAIYVTHDQEESSMVGDTVGVIVDGRLLQRAEPDELWRQPASVAVARFLGNKAFLTADDARALGWSGSLPAGHVLGVGPRSLELHPDGVPVQVLDEGFDLGHVEIGVELPNGQRAVVRSEERAGAETVRVRLVGGAVTPADAPT
ncbi:ABC transporter ATP-binding protein [Tessaracoccus rhinocerotis]|uniref:ABC-type quaternary amine transporter n=1 Tax=Tessaracoccus rhinocerotis TaxID=1689449 RepID=A0A553K1J5_9ACTN|nr:ABC transporter ATP-binding protein [Tessaracoccus rhinocerotis]TRY18572.1 ABC transporter ATP-binding protein [Tessaracoccus rhinocerotis]